MCSTRQAPFVTRLLSCLTSSSCTTASPPSSEAYQHHGRSNNAAQLEICRTRLYPHVHPIIHVAQRISTRPLLDLHHQFQSTRFACCRCCCFFFFFVILVFVILVFRKIQPSSTGENSGSATGRAESIARFVVRLGRASDEAGTEMVEPHNDCARNVGGSMHVSDGHISRVQFWQSACGGRAAQARAGGGDSKRIVKSRRYQKRDSCCAETATRWRQLVVALASIYNSPPRFILQPNSLRLKYQM